MIMTRRIVTASLFAFIVSISPQARAVDGTRIEEFLSWDRAAQDTFINVSVLTAGVIATQIRPDFAGCIGDWYSNTDVGKEKRRTEILDIMAGYPTHLPSGIIIAILQKECGKFGDL